MLMTENLVAVATLVSTSSLPMTNLSDCSVANSSRMGAMVLHGPHHSAQKSTRTGFSEAPIISSNVASVRVVICSLIAASKSSATCERRGLHLSGDPSLTHRFEPPFGVYGRNTARSGRGDPLAIDELLHVARGKKAVNVGVRAESGAHVAVLFEVDLIGDEVGIGDMANGDEHTG